MLLFPSFYFLVSIYLGYVAYNSDEAVTRSELNSLFGLGMTAYTIDEAQSPVIPFFNTDEEIETAVIPFYNADEAEIE